MINQDLSKKEQNSWEIEHGKHSYKNTLSITEDKNLLNKISGKISQFQSKPYKILNAGCGSKHHLANHIVNRVDKVALFVNSDYSTKAVEAQNRRKHRKIMNLTQDNTNLNFADGSFNCVITMNSVVSGNHETNLKCLSEFYRVLKPNGILIGVFPTINSFFEIAHSSQEFEPLLTDGSLDYGKSVVYEKNQDLMQIFYPPLKLRKILRDLGFSIEEFQNIFLSSDYFDEEYSRLYDGFKDPNRDICVYEHLVVARKA